MVNNEKKKITLSIPVETNNTLEEMARKHGMTKSGLVTFLINQLKEKRKRFYVLNKKKPLLQKGLCTKNIFTHYMIVRLL